jgi:photosystem II stability/assembly factor-like uncharacterized protein
MQPSEWWEPALLNGYFIDASRAWVTTSLISPESPQRFITYGQVVLSTQDGGATWQTSILPKSKGTGFPEIKFITPDRGWIVVDDYVGAGGEHLAIFTTEDGGKTWDSVYDELTSIFDVLGDIDWTADGTGLMAFKHVGFIDTPFVRWTHDGGRSWDQWQDLPIPPNPADSDPNVQFFECWTESPNEYSATEAKLLVMCRITANAAYTYQSYLYSTKDGGENWHSQPAPNGTLLMHDDNLGWIFGRDIYRTTDGGAYWAHLKTVAWNGQFNPVDRDHIWAIARSGDESALVGSSDGGRSWSLITPRAAP